MATVCFAHIITSFLFPLTNVYSMALAPIFAGIFFGIILISASVIYEMKFLLWCGIASWIGGCLMAYLEGFIVGIILILVVFIDFIVPGIILNKKYKIGRK